jgi:hypothetical protein
LNPSFRALAFNALQAIIRYGYPENQFCNKQIDPDGKRAASSIKTAKKVFQALAKQYPDDVPEYCKDLLNEQE